MVRVSLLVFEDTFGTAIFPSLDLLRYANNFMLETTGKEVFKIQLVGYKQRKIQIDTYATVFCDTTMDESPLHDLILVPGLHVSYLANPKPDYYEPLCNWLRNEHRKGVAIGSLCLGSLLLGYAGLLRARPCTTHWAGVEAMRRQFPAACLQADHTITHTDNIYTSGGAFSSLQLVLFFIEQYCGKDVALFISKMTAIDYPRPSQSQFYILDQQKRHNDEAILHIQAHMESHYANPLKMDALAKQANMSTRNFIRRFKKATGETPIRYLQKIRIEVAKGAFEKGNTSVLEVMDSTGYQDIKSFALLFKRLTGLTPAAYARKFGVEAAV